MLKYTKKFQAYHRADIDSEPPQKVEGFPKMASK